MKVTIYHNPRCSKSRATLALLEQRNVEPEIVHYLDTPPDRDELEKIIRMPGIAPRDLIRRGEPEFARLGLKPDDLGEQEVIDAILAYPKLLQRPIVTSGGQARIGRPPESVLEIL